MSLKLGNTAINKLYLGSTEIKKAYLGSTLVYDDTGLPAIASYPLADNSNEVIGTTSGINGVDTSMSYDGTEATFNGTTSLISLPDNNIFSFTDGAGNDEPFTIEFDVNIDTLSSNVYFINKRAVAAGTDEWQFRYNTLNVLSVFLFSQGGTSAWLRVDVTEVLPLNTDINLKLTYDGSNTSAGIKLYLDGSVLSTSSNDNGTYLGMNNTTATVTIGRRGDTAADYLDGTMKNLNFYNYVK